MADSNAYGDGRRLQQVAMDEVVAEYLVDEFEDWWRQVVQSNLPPGEPPPMPVDFVRGLCAMAFNAGSREERSRHVP